MKVSTAYKHYKKGIREVMRGGKRVFQIKTERGNWKTVPRSANVWHRGNGKFSHYTRKMDKKAFPGAGTVEGKKKRGKSTYPHTGDKQYKPPSKRFIPGTTKKKDAKYGKAKRRKGLLRRFWSKFRYDY